MNLLIGNNHLALITLPVNPIGLVESVSTSFKPFNQMLLGKAQGLLKHYFSFTTNFESCAFEIFLLG